MSDAKVLTFEHIEEARQRIGDRLDVTPLAKGQNLSDLTGSRLWFKLENLRITGSFKERGALNKLLTLTDAERDRGVVAVSAGNHAQGVALHATKLGIRSTIVMPAATPIVKVMRTRRYGAEVILHGTGYDDAAAFGHALCSERDATFVHPFDDIEVMAGQGTIGLEILEQNPYLQSVIVPIGGGGLISGIACAIKETNPRIRVIGVQTTALPSMLRAIEAGHPVELPYAPTMADGIAVRRAGENTLASVREYVDEIVTVSDEEIAEAILLLLEEEKVVAEGAGAAGLAAVVSNRIDDIAGKRCGIIVCGGNIDTNVIAHIIDRGLVRAGRRVRLVVTVPDKPGSLATLTRFVADRNANVLEIHHDRAFARAAFGETTVTMTVETRGADHVHELRRDLDGVGYSVVDVPGFEALPVDADPEDADPDDIG